MPHSYANLAPVMPEIVMTCLAIFLLMAELVIKQKEMLGLFSIISAGIVCYLVLGSAGETFGACSYPTGTARSSSYLPGKSRSYGPDISQYLQTMKINFGEYYALAALCDAWHDAHGVCS